MSEIEGVEKPVCEYAKKKGFYVRKMHWIGRRGAPDRMFFGYGMAFWIEFKAPGEPLKLHQKREIDKMKGSGLIVQVIDDPRKGIELIDEMCKIAKRH